LRSTASTVRGILLVSALFGAGLANAQVGVAPASVAAAIAGVPYSQTLTASGGGGGPYTWSATLNGGGALPGWLSIASTGSTTAALTGTPPAATTLSITVTAHDVAGLPGSQNYSLPINFANTVITTNIPAGMAIVNISSTSGTATVGGNGASNSFNANGGTQTQWSGPFNTAGQLLEYTLNPGQYTMRVISPTDAAILFPSLTNTQLTAMWTAWTYNSPWLTDFLVFDSSASSNGSETQLFSGAGGSPGTSDAASAYADAVNGYMGSTPVAPYDNSLALTYRNATPQKTVTLPLTGSGAETLIFVIPDGGVSDNTGGVSVLIAPYTSAPAITTSSVPNAQVGVAYPQTQLNASGGSGTYWWTATGLPAGLNLSRTGLLTGTPSTNQTYQTTFTVTDPVSGLFATSSTFMVTVAQSLQITTVSLPTGAVNESYATSLSVSGGIAPYTWTSSDKPSWMSLASNAGILSGTPPSSGIFQFHVTVMDSTGGSYTTTVPLVLGVAMPVGYLVQNTSSNGFVFAPGDGTTPQVEASMLFGSDVAVDSGVNGIVATGNALKRITSTGTISTIATAPSGSAWVAVAVDPSGYLIVGDNLLHKIWRVSPDGVSATILTGYSVPNPASAEHIKIVIDIHGNYIVAEDNNNSVELYSITPGGTSIASITPTGASPHNVSGLVFENATGAYLLLDAQSSAVFRIAPNGTTSQIDTGVTGSPGGLVANPLTGQLITAASGQLNAITGTGVATLTSTSLISNPSGIALVTEDFPSTVDATYPLAYFRLETNGGSSERSGAYGFVPVGGASITSSGAPTGLASNNAVVLDGSTGYVSSSLSGGINSAGSIMAWINLAALPSTSSEGFNYIAGESTSGNDFDLQISNSNVLGFFTTASGQSISYTPNVSTLANNWHMVVATFDATAGTRAIYWDGALVASDNTVSFTNKTGQFQIGASSVFGGRNFNGSIDEVAVWNYSLTANQVYRMYATRPYGTSIVSTSLSPSSAPPSTQTALTISGSGFVSGSTVRVTSAVGITSILTPSSISTSQIAVTLPSNILLDAGVAEIAVVSPTGVPANQLPFTVQAQLSISPPSGSLPSGQTNVPYSQTLTASGGSGNYAWSITGEPSGLGLSLSSATGSTTNLTGTPTTVFADGAQITVQLQDTVTNATVSQSYEIQTSEGTPPQLPQPSNTVAYVLNLDGTLVAVANGASSTIVGRSVCDVCAFDMARDASGNFIVAADTELISYTPQGGTAFIASSNGLHYNSVAIDGSGNYIVGDGVNHKIYKLVPGSLSAPAVTIPYSVSLPQSSEDVYVRVDSAGNYVVAEDNDMNGDGGGLEIYVITPGAQPATTTLNIQPVDSNPYPSSVGGMTFDANGNYVVVDWFNNVIFKITKASSQNAGVFSVLFGDPSADFCADGDPADCDAEGIYLDPQSGQYFITDDDTNALYTLNSGGVLSEIASGSNFSGGPVSVVVVDGPPALSITPSAGPLHPGQVSSSYLQRLTAFGGSGNYSWSITNQSSGLNLSLTSQSGNSICLSGTLGASPTDGTITILLTDTTTSATFSQTYTLVVTAVPAVAWTVSASFNDGGTLSGYFNLSGQTVTNWNLTTTSGSTLGSFNYNPSNSSVGYAPPGSGSGCPGPCVTFISNASFPDGGFNENLVLELGFLSDLTDGGTVGLFTDNSQDQASHECLDCSPFRLVTSGSATAGIAMSSLTSGAVAYVLGEDGSITPVSGATPLTPIVSNQDCECFFSDMARDAAGNLIIVAGSQLQVYPPTGGTPTATITAQSQQGSLTQIPNFFSVALDAAGKYIVADSANGTILRITPAAGQTPATSVKVGSFPAAEDASVRVDSSGNYIVATDNGVPDSDAFFVSLYRITPAGTTTSIPLTLSGQSTYPSGVSGLTFDANGNYVLVDWDNIAIYSIGAYGTANVGKVSTLFGDPNGVLSEPAGISRDPASGNYYFVDDENDVLYQLSPDGGALLQVASGLDSPSSVLIVNAITITTTSLPSATVNQPYTALTLTENGGTGPFTWSATGLPAGVTLTTAGVLSGTPTATGTFHVQIMVSDSAQHNASITLALVVSAAVVVTPPPAYPTLSISSTSLPNGTVGVPYSGGVTASGGSGHYFFAFVGLPPGLGLSGSSSIGGTPTTAGTFTIGVSVNDPQAGLAASASFSITITSAPLSISGSSNLGGFAASASISAGYTASGGLAPYKWSASGLPAGLSINASTGSLSGSVAKPGNYSFTVQLTDSQPTTTSISVSMFVLGITTTSLPDASNKVPYSQTLSAQGGSAPYAWSANGALPPGLSLSGSGVVSGTPVLSGSPTAAQSFSFGISVSSGGVTVSSGFSINVTIKPQTLSIPGGGLPDAPVFTGYSAALQAAGGIPPYSWSLLANGLPDGLSLTSSGTISGTPTKIGSFAFTAKVSDSTGAAVSSAFSIAVVAPPLTVTSTSLPAGIAGTAYPVQTFTASGGNSPYTFSLKGSLPAGLTLSNGSITGTPTASGTSTFTVTATDSSVPALTASTDLQIAVTPPHTDLVLSSSSLSFSFNQGAITIPAGNTSSVSVGSNSAQPLNYSVSVTPAASWLDVTAGSGNTPGSIGVTLDPKALNLASGTFQTSIVVTCVSASGSSQPSPCNGSSQSVSVTLNVMAAPPLLSTSPSLLSFTALSTQPKSSSQSITIQNAGGGTITVNSVTTGSSWVSFSGTPAALNASGAATVGVTANSNGLAAGYYESNILISTSAGNANIPVSLLVSPSGTMTLNPSGNQYQMVSGSSPGNNSGSFLVGVNSSTSVSWTASAQGATWLQVSNTNGASTSTSPGTVNYTINPAVTATLSAGAYYGTILVTAAGAVNSPQSFLVVLNVAAAPAIVQPDPEPAGLLFLSNGGSLPPQTVNVYSSSPTPEGFAASSDSSWLVVSTAGGSTSASSPGISSVSVNPGNLPPGTYRGGVSYQFTGSDVSSGVRTVNVTLVIEGTGGASAPSARESLKPEQTSGCAPSQLVPTQTGLVSSFSQPASWPTPLTILLVDNCGNKITNGQVVATFSNGDPPLQLSATNAASGNYTGTWTPRATSSQITISARASAANFTPQIVEIAGQVTPAAAPLLSPGGTLNAFAPVLGAAIAPGSIVQIYGSNLAGQSGQASTIPLPSKLNSTSVLIGGMFAPLYYVSPTQINAQVPFELTAGNQYQVIVNANGALSTPNPIQVSATAPGIASFAAGGIIAQHLDGSLVLDTSPAAPGEVIVFYVAGMGQTNQDVTTGAASPSTNLAVPLDVPAITVADVPVTNILFAGLTPTLVGLYQVDFQVPATVPNGDQPLVLTQKDGSANTTVLPVHN
jgi:uncharacterized protein (TIGR03437 family)